MKPETGTIILLDVGNSNTRVCFSTGDRILGRKMVSAPTDLFFSRRFLMNAAGAMKDKGFERVVACCVVPKQVPKIRRFARRLTGKEPLFVRGGMDLGIRIRYPNRRQIGADRLANAVGARRLYGAPAIVVDFGTAVTFDVVNARGEYVGGVIAPGLSAMTDYLYEHTALLPRVELREPRSPVGKSTVDAMRVGAVLGYRGLVKEILAALRRERGLKGAVAIATGGYGDLIARKVREIDHVNPLLTMEGLRFIYLRKVTGT